MTKDEKIKDLLAVLDMPREEQQKWWEDNYGEKFGCGNCLPDLAFRLRDEARKQDAGEFRYACEKVYDYVLPVIGIVEGWWCYESQPIHWIISSLIAKVKDDEKEG